MDKERCQYLLRARRANGADDDDPAMQEALAFARNDPELRRWLEDAEAADRAIVAKFRELRAPATLRQQILDGLAVSTPRQPRRIARPLALTLASLAAAASVALAIYTAMGGPKPVQSFDRLVATAVTETREQPSLSFHASAAAELRAWLAGQSAPIPGVLPGRLAALETIGCGTFDWNGVQGSVVSFRVEPASNLSAAASAANRAAADATTAAESIVYLFTIPQQSCAGGAIGTQPTIFAQTRTSLATWRDAEHVYIVTSAMPETSLRELLSEARAGTTAAAIQPPSQRNHALQPQLARDSGRWMGPSRARL